MRNIIGFALLAIFAIATAARAEMVPLRSISVSGSAERKVVPDEAHVYVTLGATHAKMAEAKKLHDAKLAKLYTIADKNSIGRNHLTTQSSSVQPHYSYNDGKQIFQGYRMVTSIDIKVADTKKLGTVIEQLMASGLEEHNQQEYGQLLSTQYTIANPDKIRDEMLAEAIKNARTKAENMAAAAGAEVTRVYQINEGDAPQFMPRAMPMMAMAKAEGAAYADTAAPPPAGEQELRSTVTVIFELKN